MVDRSDRAYSFKLSLEYEKMTSHFRSLSVLYFIPVQFPGAFCYLTQRATYHLSGLVFAL